MYGGPGNAMHAPLANQRVEMNVFGLCLLVRSSASDVSVALFTFDVVAMLGFCRPRMRWLWEVLVMSW
jgi:hypothetical protein